MALLERMIFYGFRGVFVIHAISEDGLKLDYTSVDKLCNWFIVLVGIAPFFMGLITDVWLRQKRAIFLGFGMLIAGFLVLLMDQSVYLSIALLVLGFGLVRVNLYILLSWLFKRSDKKRDIGFMVLFIFIEIGGFLSFIPMSYFDTNLFFRGFDLFVLATLGSGILFLMIQNKLSFSERYFPQKNEPKGLNDSILELEKENEQYIDLVPTPKLQLALLMVGLFIFTFIMELAGIKMDALFKINGLNLYEVLKGNGFGYIVALVLLFVFARYRTETSNTWHQIAGFYLLFAFTILAIFTAIFLDNNYVLLWIIEYIMFTALTSIFAPLVMSFITRMSNSKYASSILGFYLTFPALAYGIMEVITLEISPLVIFLCFVTTLFLSGVLFIGGNKLAQTMD